MLRWCTPVPTAGISLTATTGGPICTPACTTPAGMPEDFAALLPVQLGPNRVEGLAAVRAHLVALDEWVAMGRPPPPSEVPRAGDGSGRARADVLRQLAGRSPLRRNRMAGSRRSARSPAGRSRPAGGGRSPPLSGGCDRTGSTMPGGVG